MTDERERRPSSHEPIESMHIALSAYPFNYGRERGGRGMLEPGEVGKGLLQSSLHVDGALELGETRDEGTHRCESIVHSVLLVVNCKFVLYFWYVVCIVT